MEHDLYQQIEDREGTPDSPATREQAATGLAAPLARPRRWAVRSPRIFKQPARVTILVFTLGAILLFGLSGQQTIQIGATRFAGGLSLFSNLLELLTCALLALLIARPTLKLSPRERQQLKRLLWRQTFQDSLTGMANRALFQEFLAHALAQANQARCQVGVILLDLDDFKLVNDSLGHTAGDNLLLEIGRRLRSCTRAADLVARLGGDEFALILGGLRSPQLAHEVARRVLEVLAEPVPVGGKQIFIRGSVGVAIAQLGCASSEELLRNADAAMYIAKARGKSGYAVFSPDMHTEAAERLELEADLAQALGRGQFVLHYQPIIDLPSGRWLGFEALLRWQHPRRGLLLPAAFLNVAEDAGHMISIGKWGLREACLQLARWQVHSPSAHSLYVSVNLTMRQFLHPAIVDDIADVLAETGLAPAQLLIEITENVALQDAVVTRRTLGALRRLGVRLAIDDFGTGFSALSYLKQFDVDLLKLDRSFLADIECDTGAAVLVSAVIAFAQRLNLPLIVEGVETDAHRVLLRDMGCVACQGFFFARPLAPQMIGEWLRSAAF